MAESRRSTLDSFLKFTQAVAVLVGVVVSVLSLSQAFQKDADARNMQAQARLLELEKFDHQREMDALARAREAAKPFLELRTERYLEAVKVAGVLADPARHTSDELEAAEKRFWELYWAELSMVENAEVERRMVELKNALEPTATLHARQQAVLSLARAIRDSMAQSWGITELDSPVTVEQD